MTGPRVVTAQSLSVAPELVGRSLATPARRLAAMLIDLLVVAVVSSAANAWVLAAGALAAWGLLRRRGTTRARPRWLAPVVAALLLIGAVDAWRLRVARPRLSEPDAAEAAAIASRSLATAASGLALAASSPDRDEAWSQAASEAALEAMATRVKSLEAEVKRLRGAPPDWRQQIAEWLDDFGLGYGGALLYFTLVPLWWPGQTAGKRLLALRVVEITGAPMTALLAFKRFGGYIAGLATGGAGFAQVMWDPNRQGLHDRAARTVVLDVRSPTSSG
ncbi:MAG TPA: RDD family protein [Burkholderiaceae bacterium]|nr:RDD family protein [Burkholderiaceae bacterium]